MPPIFGSGFLPVPMRFICSSNQLMTSTPLNALSSDLTPVVIHGSLKRLVGSMSPSRMCWGMSGCRTSGRAMPIMSVMPCSSASSISAGVRKTAGQAHDGAVQIELLDAGGEVGEVHASGAVLLVTGIGGEGRFLQRAAGDLDQVDTEISETLDDGQGFVLGEASFLSIRRVEFDRHGEIASDRFAHGLVGFDEEPHAVVEAAAVLVGALVVERGKELVDQVAVRAMQLHAGKPGLLGQSCGGGKALLDVVDLRAVEFSWFGEELAVFTFQLARAGSPWMRVDGGWGLTAGMVELHPALHAVHRACFGPRAKWGKVAIVFQCHVAGFSQLGVVDHHVAGHQHARAALGPLPVQSGETLGRRVIAVRHGLVHGGLEETVLDVNAATQFDRLCEMGGAGGVLLVHDGSFTLMLHSVISARICAACSRLSMDISP